MGNYQFRTKTAQAIFARLPDSLGENDWALKELSDRDGLAATYFHNRALLVLTAVQNSRSLPQGLQNLCRQQLSKSIDALKDYLQERASGSKDPAQLELRAEALAQSAFNLERVCRDVAQRDTAVGRVFGENCWAVWNCAQAAAVEVEARALQREPTDALLKEMSDLAPRPFEPGRLDPSILRPPADVPVMGGHRAAGGGEVGTEPPVLTGGDPPSGSSGEVSPVEPRPGEATHVKPDEEV